MTAEFEPVHSVEDYYEGPRTGIACLRGLRYRFRSVGWTSPDGPDGPWDPYDDCFELSPIEGDGGDTLVVRGEFRVRQPVPELSPGVLRPLEVRWSTLTESTDS